MDIVVAIMIKNEETAICGTLKPFIDDGFTNFFIYDTGSTDNTVEVVTKFLKESGVRFIVKREDFTNFSESRNKCIKHTGDLFNKCRVIVTLDCEWYITNAKGIIEFFSKKTKINNCYQITIKGGGNGTVFYQCRIFSINTNSYYAGSVHEVIVNAESNDRLPDDIYFEWRPNAEGAAKSANRYYNRDLPLLLKEYRETKDPRSTFYLAQTYECIGDVDNQMRYFKERGEMTNGFVEEQFIALYRVGRSYDGESQRLSNIHYRREKIRDEIRADNKKYDVGSEEYKLYMDYKDYKKESMEFWDQAHKYYMLAYENRPSRIEPLVRLAQHYTNAHVKYTFAKQACSIPYTTDGLFVEKNFYDYDRWDQLAIGAWYMNNYQEAYEALQIAIKIHPDYAHIQRNMKMVREKLFPNEVLAEALLESEQESKIRILNLILYSEDPDYIEMYKIQSAYLKAKGVDHYFYCYKSDLEEEFLIVDDILYIKGEESYIPGILNKTLSSFSYFLDKLDQYDYVVRSNISSCLNFDLLKRSLVNTPIDFGGPLYYKAMYPNSESGLIGEKFDLYGSLGMVSGLCIIFSPKGIKFILDNIDVVKSYALVDDLSLTIPFKTIQHNLIDKEIGPQDSGKIAWNSVKFSQSAIVYRNRSDLRSDDVENMKKITTLLLSNKIVSSQELDDLYTSACSTHSDINEHVEKLNDLSSQCNSVLELGVSRFTSTWGILHGLSANTRYIGFANYNPHMDYLSKANNLCKIKGVDFKFIIGKEMNLSKDQMDMIGEVDMVFIDALHTYCHVTYELEKFSPLTRKYLAFHDSSEPWGDRDDSEYHGNYSEYPAEYDREKRGVWPAIEDFLVRHPEWILDERKLNNHGFVTLKRITAV